MTRHKAGHGGALRTAPYVAVSAALLLACNRGAPREEQQQAQTPPIVKAPPRPAEPREAKGPIRNPQKDRPPERSGDQLPDGELEAALKQATKERDKGDLLAAMQTLRKCINKIPASARCEGEYAFLAYETGRRRAEVHYYLEQVAATDAPKAKPDFYRRVGATAMKAAKYDLAVPILQKATEGTKKQVEPADFARYAKALQALGEREQAVNALTEAYTRDPKSHEWLFERAVLVAQLQRTKEAAKLMEEYYGKTKGKDAKRDELVKQRIKELGGRVPQK